MDTRPPRLTARCACHGDALTRCLPAHPQGLESHTFEFPAALDWDLLGNWLGTVGFFWGSQIERITGLVYIEGDDAPHALHGERHLLHPPCRMPRTRTTERISRIDFITTGLPRDLLAQALERARQDLRQQVV